MRGNRGMNSWIIVVYARCAGSLQVSLLERKVHATKQRIRQKKLSDQTIFTQKKLSDKVV